VLARSLKAEGGSYGFEPISESAVSLEKLAAENAPLATIKSKAEELTRWCLLARASARSKAAKPN
jgi:hypothetical protein